MAVTITSPQSAVVARGAFTLAWTHDYPQARYEVLYRKKGESAWQTFGQVASTATNITVNCNVFDDFVEYQYRVIVYSEYAEGTETTYSGNDASAAYAVVIVPASQVGTMKAKYGDSMIEVPLYTTLQQGSYKISSTSGSGGNRNAQLLTDAQSQQFASGIKANDGNNTRAIPDAVTADELTNPGEPSYKYVVSRTGYYTYYYLPAYYNYVAAQIYDSPNYKAAYYGIYYKIYDNRMYGYTYYYWAEYSYDKYDRKTGAFVGVRYKYGTLSWTNWVYSRYYMSIYYYSPSYLINYSRYEVPAYYAYTPAIIYSSVYYYYNDL